MIDHLTKNTLRLIGMTIALSTLMAGCAMPNGSHQTNDGTKSIPPVSVAAPTQSDGVIKTIITSPADGSTLVPVNGFVEIKGATIPWRGVNFVAGFKNPEKWRTGEEEGTLSLEPVQADGKGGFLVRIEENMIPEGEVYFAAYASPDSGGSGASKDNAAIVKVFHTPSSAAADPTLVEVTPTLPTTLPTTCTDEQEGTPVITSLSSYSGPIGTKLEINGCNLSGFEGDQNAWIENDQGMKGVLHGEDGSTSKLLRIALESSLCQTDDSYSGMPCDAWLSLVPGSYKIYVTPWGKESNKIGFTIQNGAAKTDQPAVETAKATTPGTATTSIVYYLLDKPAGSPNFCDGENMDSVGYKAALTKKMTQTVPGNLAIEEKIRATLRLAVADSGSFGENYALTADTTFENGIVTMHSANGWAGSSIFYCAWKPFVEKNLEQFSDVKEIKWGSAEPSAVIPNPDETSNWPTYTNPTVGYSIKYPTTWTENQSKVFEAGVSEEAKTLDKVKDLNIEFYDGGILKLRIASDFITGGGDPSSLALASEVPAPKDKTTISGVVAYKMGGFDGYRRLVTVSDPASQGLEYITTNKYDHTYFMSTFEKGESTEIVDMLKTFAIQLKK
jgi:hypothetical protein